MSSKTSLEMLDFEIEFYEGILRRRPLFVQALIAIGDAYTKKGLYEKGLKVDETLAYLKPNDATVLYNLSCSYSLLNQIDDAFKTIKRAIQSGYDDYIHLEIDSDLTNLRKDLRFKRYFSRIKDLKASTKKN